MKNLLFIGLLISLFSQGASATYENNLSSFYKLDPEIKENIRNNFKARGWIHVATSNEFQTYVNYNYVRWIHSGIVDAWVKHIVINDITKDGLSLSDYSMVLGRYNCKEKTSRLISYTNYSKKGNIIASYNYGSYQQDVAIIPNSIGEKVIDEVCFIGEIN